jgi:hypothetical protein
MGGGLMQLVAYGAQDVYLTGNPVITFFKAVYRRHTNFAMESIQQTFNGNPSFGKTASVTISRNGDLITNAWLQINLPKLTPGNRYVNAIGHALIKSVELEIGGQKIDKHYGSWLDIWSHLTVPEEKRAGFMKMVGESHMDPSAFLGESAGQLASNAPYNGQGGLVYVPLQFFFCRNAGLALPLIALQYHEVKINIEFNSIDALVLQHVDDLEPIKFVDNNELDCGLWVDYVYLDTDERRRFAQVSHEMLIEQLQFSGAEGGAKKVTLNLNHPVKELVWVLRDPDAKNPFNYACQLTEDTVSDTVQKYEYNTDDAIDIYDSARLLLNGHERFAARPASYFRLVQPYQHHTRVPGKFIYSYSFALKPEEHQPSGTCNFSRIDNAHLEFEGLKQMEGGAPSLHVYAVNYNILRIVSGMGGLAFSN